MAGESSPKRRRIIGPFDYDSDDDDLFFQPHEASARRDPSYKLSVRRANADHKLQATMAHIIEKYSHDFEGIGDEIDMETGEIVVNNGHLHNMRDEGDVGVGEGWTEGQEDEDDDGVLLEEIAGQESEGRDRDDSANDPNAEDGAGDSEDEELIMTGRGTGTAKPSNSLVRTTQRNPKGQGGKLSSLFPNPFGGAFGGPPFGFNPSPFAPNPSSSFAFGASPLAMEPWRYPNGFQAPTWGGREPRIGYGPATNRLIAGTEAPRYEFPAREGYKSIWSSGSSYEDDWASRPSTMVRAGFRGQVLKSPATNRKLLGAPPTSSRDMGDEGGEEEEDEDDEDDEEAILTGKPSKKKELIDVVQNNSDGEDDLMLLSADLAITPAKPSPARMKGKSAMREVSQEKLKATATPKPPPQKSNPKKRKFRPSSEVVEQATEPKKQLVAARIRKPPSDPEAVEDGSSDRRRSGRVRRQTEFIGKVNWMAPDRKRKTAEMLIIELRRMDPASRAEFRSIDAADETGGQPTPPASDASQVDESSEAEKEAGTDAAPEVIPDSEDSGTSFTSSAPREARSSAPSYPRLTRRNDAGAAGLLSDDEAPVLLPETKKAPVKPDTPEPIPTNPNPESALGFARVAVADTQVGVEPQSGCSEPPQPRRRGRPKKTSTAAVEPPDRPEIEETSVEISASPQVPVSVDSEVLKPRRRGRPRKSDPSPVVREEPRPEPEKTPPKPGSETEQSSVAGPVETIDAPARLSRELRWLQKKGEGLDIPEQSDGGQNHGAERILAGRKRLRHVASRDAIALDNDTGKNKSKAEPEKQNLQPPAPAPAPAPAEETVILPDLPEQPPSSKPTRILNPPTSTTTPRKPKPKLHDPKEPASSPSKPKPSTPRHTAIRTSHAPSSRRSLLSLLSLLSDDDDDDDQDELSRAVAPLPKPHNSAPPRRRVWRSSTLTTEVTATPTAQRIADPGSPGNVVKTPGGTVRTCGVDGYTCGRDFCFACL